MVSLSEMLVLETAGLLSKWGFNDGDIPEEVYDLIVDENLDWRKVAWRDELLPLLVEKYVLPLLDQKVETYRIGSPHNPIRAASVQEEIITDSVIYNAGSTPPVKLTPELVEIPMSIVLDELHSLIKEAI